MTTPGTLLCLGFGYSARTFAKSWEAYGTYRREPFSTSGVTPVPWGDMPEGITHVLVSAAPDAQGDPSIRVYTGKLNQVSWIGYLSTTAVYGDHQGGWVDETTPLTPSSERGKWRVQAEQEWLATGLPVQIFRLAGIYGPGRGPFEKVRNGTAQRVIKPGQVFSRIHVEDIAKVLHASITKGKSGDIWNVCDDDPAPPEDVIGRAAELLHLPLPPAVPFEQAEMTPMARSFYSENKRVRNDKIKRQLGVTLRFPTYREGLAAILASDVSFSQQNKSQPGKPQDL
jgi:nucleoside-diphosphate-sugar epimerase